MYDYSRDVQIDGNHGGTQVSKAIGHWYILKIGLSREVSLLTLGTEIESGDGDTSRDYGINRNSVLNDLQ